MKTFVLRIAVFAVMCTAFTQAFAQYPKITIKQLQYVSPTDLANCMDTSSYEGDTVTVVGVVAADANLIDVPSSSVQGGFRPFVHILDTADGGKSGDFHGLQVMGVYTDASGNSLPVSDVFNLYAGMVIEVTGVVSSYYGETQLSILNNSSMTVIGNQKKPEPIVVDLGDLNDNNRINQIPTGEEYEDSYVEIRDVTVTSVVNFGGNRVSFDVADNDGNVINVSDRFFVQKTTSYTTTRSTAPEKKGSFKPPVVGAKFEYIRGIVMHSENGCTGNNGRGFEINPFDTSHYKQGLTPPSITQVVRTPLVPKSTEKVMISANIVDFDGAVVGAKLFYSSNMADTYDKFTEVSLTLKSGTTDTYEGEIPANSENTIVRYYLTATDDMGQKSYMPFVANSSTESDFMFYTVRDGGLSISDVQRVLNVSRDASPFLNQTVTVTGVVTASAKAYDLENIYIQDPTQTEWAGIKCQGNSELIKLFRGEEVTVRGTVAESFGFTVLNVTSVVKTGNVKTVPVTAIDPSDSTLYFSKEAEKYEGMLVGLTNSSGGKVYVSNPKYSNFGEYLISTNSDATYGRSRKVQAGIQNNNNSSSLWVSLVSDTTLKDNEGAMNVKAIAAQKGMSFDTVVGIFYYGFGNFSVLPRNNDDFVGSSISLPETDYPDMVSVRDLRGTSVSVYPNPVQDLLTLDVTGEQSEIEVQIIDLTGRTLISEKIQGRDVINTSSLLAGMYVVRLVDSYGNVIGSTRILKN